MRRIALILLLFAGCAEPQPPEFVSKEHTFRVRFGGVPTEFDRPDNGIPSKLYTLSTADGAYTVRAYNLPITAEQASEASTNFASRRVTGRLYRSAGAWLLSASATTRATSTLRGSSVAFLESRRTGER